MKLLYACNNLSQNKIQSDYNTQILPEEKNSLSHDYNNSDNVSNHNSDDSLLIDEINCISREDETNKIQINENETNLLLDDTSQLDNINHASSF